MTTKSETFLSNLLRKRAVFRPGKTRKQRQQQYNNQTLMLGVVIAATVIAAGIWMYINYNGSGSASTVDCENYPEYCVPLAGGATGSDQFVLNESASARPELTADESVLAAGVVRGYTAADHRPFIGNPNAPVHVWIVASFTCSHCQDYHDSDFRNYLDNFVLTGQATVEYSSYSGVGGYSATRGMQAALCAGEQGAFWEFSDEMYRLAESMSAERAFATSRITQAADEMGLDDSALRRCLNSNRYDAWTDQYDVQAQDYGVTGTPNIFIRYGDSSDWRPVSNPGYGTLANLTRTAIETGGQQ
jgi:protein-disulfide isomerase